MKPLNIPPDGETENARQLGSIPAGSQYCIVATDVVLSYRTVGDPGARPMVLLHGSGSGGSTWSATAEAFADRWRVYTPDLRGYGNSSWPGEYSLEVMRDDVLAFIDKLGLEHVVVIGHSMGAVIAYLAAERLPHRIDALVLEEPPPPVPLDLPAPQHPAGPSTHDPAVRDAIVAQLNAPDPSWRTKLTAITAPTLLIAGGQQSHLPQAGLAEMAARLPAGQLVTIPAGHGVHATRPADFQRAVRDFLTPG
jgi:pimeloyl-ACP methyl ester carboxylesterase